MITLNHSYLLNFRSDHAWQTVASDLFELNGQMYLLVIDYFSRYTEIAKLFNRRSQSVMNHLKSIFARHGIRECVMFDGVPQYVSFFFKVIRTIIWVSTYCQQSAVCAIKWIGRARCSNNQNNAQKVGRRVYRSTQLSCDSSS